MPCFSIRPGNIFWPEWPVIHVLDNINGKQNAYKKNCSSSINQQ